MPVAISVFGVGKQGSRPTFCYAFIRLIRGSGDYPPPTLPDDASGDGVTRTLLPDFEQVELTTWDRTLNEEAKNGVLAGLAEGRLALPQECPVGPGTTLSGMIYEAIIVREENDRLRISGTGILRFKGFVIDGAIDPIFAQLVEAVGIASAPASLAQLIQLIATPSGLGSFFKDRRRLGAVDRFYQRKDDERYYEPLFNVAPEKLDL